MKPFTFNLASVAVLVACASMAAQAAEEVPAAPRKVRASDGRSGDGLESYAPGAAGLFGASHSSWQTPSKLGAGATLRLADAVAAVFPPQHPPASLEFDQALASTQLTLNPGLHRRNTLDLGLRGAGLGAVLNDGKFLVYRAAAAPSPRPATIFESPPPASSRAVQPGQGQSQTAALRAALAHPSWQTPAPGPVGQLATAQAIGFLFPPGHPTTRLMVEAEVSRSKSTWPAGSTRAEAMSAVLTNAGLTASFQSGDFRVRPAAGPMYVSMDAGARTGYADGQTDMVARDQVAQVDARAAADPARQALDETSNLAQYVPAQPRAANATPASIPLDQVGQRRTTAASRDVRNWNVNITDVNLANTFSRWAMDAGYKIKWDASKHVLIGASMTFTGTFEDAVEQALDTPGIRNSQFPLEVCIYSNNPPLARVTRMGDQFNDCK